MQFDLNVHTLKESSGTHHAAHPEQCNLPSGHMLPSLPFARPDRTRIPKRINIFMFSKRTPLARRSIKVIFNYPLPPWTIGYVTLDLG